MRQSILALLLAAALTSAGCEEPKDSWVKALKDCGVTDVNSSKILYFGPSNNVGPGSGWRETLDERGNHVDYRLRFGYEDLPKPNDFINLSPSGYQCKGGRKVSFQLSGNVAANVSTLPITVELSNDLKKAKNVTVTVGGMGWDQLKELAYEMYFKQVLGPGNKYYEDMNIEKRLVLLRALAVKDLVMVYEFSASDKADLKAKYTGPVGGGSKANIGGGLTVDWESGNNVTVTAPQSAWILGELVAFRSSSGFEFAPSAGPAGAPLMTVDIPKGTPILVEGVP